MSSRTPLLSRLHCRPAPGHGRQNAPHTPLLTEAIEYAPAELAVKHRLGRFGTRAVTRLCSCTAATQRQKSTPGPNRHSDGEQAPLTQGAQAGGAIAAHLPHVALHLAGAGQPGRALPQLPVEATCRRPRGTGNVECTDVNGDIAIRILRLRPNHGSSADDACKAARMATWGMATATPTAPASRTKGAFSTTARGKGRTAARVHLAALRQQHAEVVAGGNVDHALAANAGPLRWASLPPEHALRLGEEVVLVAPDTHWRVVLPWHQPVLQREGLLQRYVRMQAHK